MLNNIYPTSEQETIKELSDLLVQAQKPIQILDAIKWDAEIERDFFAKGCKELPKVNANYYAARPLSFDPRAKIEEWYQIEGLIIKKLGQYNPIGKIMQRMCDEYRGAARMLMHRGLPEFYDISQTLYGSSDEVFYTSGPTTRDLATSLNKSLPALALVTTNGLDEKKYTAQQAVEILQERLSHYFTDPSQPAVVEVNDKMVADAAAGAESIKVKATAMFSERDLRVLEVHEGWVHLGTTLNGRAQPICTFLSKGPPSATVTQEGLAVLMEIFTFTSHPARLQRLTNRIIAIAMAEDGANFLEVFNFFREHGHGDVESYHNTVRIFRGSTPEGKPFTKDLSYTKGFVMIYNYIRLAIKHGLLKQIPLLFLGKTTLSEVHLLAELVEEGLIIPPKYVPPQFSDMAALSSWMSFSLFMTQLDMKRLEENYKYIL